LNKANRIRTELLAHALEKAIPRIQTFLLYLERKGKAPNTVLAYRKNLIILARKADLQKPTEVERAIATYKKKNRPATNHYKSKLCDCYARYCKYYKIEWEKPIYTPKLPARPVPTRERTSMFVASAKGELSMKIDIIRQAGYKPIEIQGEKGMPVKDFHKSSVKTASKVISKQKHIRFKYLYGEKIYSHHHNCQSDNGFTSLSFQSIDAHYSQ
jgi:hypothetical protein